MTKTWLKQNEPAPDPLVTSTEKLVLWVRDNRDLAVGVGGTVLLVILLGAYFAVRYFQVRTQAWDKLALAEAYFYANRADMSLKAIGDMRQETPSAPAAQFGGLMEADILYRQGKFTDSAASYRAFLDSQPASKLAPLAQAGLASAQEAAGKGPEAVVSYRRFMEQFPDHFLAPEVQTGLARTLDSMGEKDQARTAYETVARLYPDTPWAAAAQERLGLAAPPKMAPPPPQRAAATPVKAARP